MGRFLGRVGGKRSDTYAIESKEETAGWTACTQTDSAISAFNVFSSLYSSMTWPSLLKLVALSETMVLCTATFLIYSECHLY